ncbi:MAG: hypothetical protein EHM58_05150 [Ignavibacteriae bacterium]|nr:MAG: hypothetical protein EHM58_05150 [Ignavibacteriota bacterium]
MKKSIVILLSAFLFTYCSLFSQSSDSASAKKIKHIGRWSLQLEVGYNFDIKSFQNLAFTSKYTFTPFSAIRFGAGVSIADGDKDVEVNEQTPVSTHASNYDLKFVTDFLFYPNPSSVIMFYLGFGPQTDYYYNYAELIETDMSKNVTDEYKWGAGLNFVIGGEWFALNSLSFFAEYNLSGVYQKGETLTYKITTDKLITDKTKSLTKDIIIKSDDARLGISLYF